MGLVIVLSFYVTFKRLLDTNGMEGYDHIGTKEISLALYIVV